MIFDIPFIPSNDRLTSRSDCCDESSRLFGVLSNLLECTELWFCALSISSLMIILNVSDSWGLENVASLGDGRCRYEGVEVTGTGEISSGFLWIGAPLCNGLWDPTHLTSLPTSSLTLVPLFLNRCCASKCVMDWAFELLMLRILSPTWRSPSLAPPTNTLMISSGVPPSTSVPPLSLKPQADWVPSLLSSTGTNSSTHWAESDIFWEVCEVYMINSAGLMLNINKYWDLRCEVCVFLILSPALHYTCSSVSLFPSLQEWLHIGILPSHRSGK